MSDNYRPLITGSHSGGMEIWTDITEKGVIVEGAARVQIGFPNPSGQKKTTILLEHMGNYVRVTEYVDGQMVGQGPVTIPK